MYRAEHLCAHARCAQWDSKRLYCYRFYFFKKNCLNKNCGSMPTYDHQNKIVNQQTQHKKKRRTKKARKKEYLITFSECAHTINKQSNWNYEETEERKKKKKKSSFVLNSFSIFLLLFNCFIPYLALFYTEVLMH